MALDPPDYLRNDLSKRPGPSEDMLLRVRDAVREARDLEQVKADQEAALEATKASLQELYYKTLPDILDLAGIPELTIEAEGNNPPVKAKAQPYYHANIAAEWDEPRRKAAFDWLEDNGHGGLIKTTVTLFFPRGDHASAKKFVEYAQKNGLSLKVGEAVAWGTLTAWLKDMVENKGETPPLETLGATVGRVVKLKPTA